MFENKYVLATMCILINVVSQSLMKGGLGYKLNGEQVVPKWAQMLGAKPLEITLGASGGGWGQILDVARNAPFAIGSILGLFFFAIWSSLISKAGLGFANGFMALFMIVISFVSFLLFHEQFNVYKITGLAVIVVGVLLLSIGEMKIIN